MLKIILISIAVFLLLNLLFFLFAPPFIIYRILLVRTKPEKWQRKCSDTKDIEQVTMFAEGEKWGEKYSDHREEVSINSAGFKLSAWYFDFGCDRAAIVIAGRSESCLYSCYFAEPYRKMGYNLLLLDNRCHGLSEGKYNNTGFTEYVDIWPGADFFTTRKRINRSCVMVSAWEPRPLSTPWLIPVVPTIWRGLLPMECSQRSGILSVTTL